MNSRNYSILLIIFLCIKVVFVDYHTPIAASRNGLKYEYGEDGVHPNKNGYNVMGPLAEEGIRKAME